MASEWSEMCLGFSCPPEDLAYGRSELPTPTIKLNKDSPNPTAIKVVGQLVNKAKQPAVPGLGEKPGVQDPGPVG